MVIVSDTLAYEALECFYTPAHHLGAWGLRLARADRRDRQSAEPEKATADDLASPEPAKTFQMWWIF